MEKIRPCTECGHFREEDEYCLEGSFKPSIANGCITSFIPKPTQCEIDKCRFMIDGKCTHKEYTDFWFLGGKKGCYVYEPSTIKEKVMKETLNYEGEKVTKGDKILSLEAVWNERPCDDEFTNMCQVFIRKGYFFTQSIDFTQDNLDLLSGNAFLWLVEEEFLNIEKGKPQYKIGQWFTREENTLTRYLLCEHREPKGVMLVRMESDFPTICTPGYWKTIEDFNNRDSWLNLTPIDSPFSS